MFKFKNKKKELKRIIESILLISYEPVKITDIEKLLSRDADKIEGLIKELQEEYLREKRGFQIKKVAGGYRFYTNPDYVDYVEKFLKSTMRGYFSQAALEVLSIIAYNQPISRKKINEIRGVRSESAISTLLSKKLISKVSEEFSPTNPLLYKTTPFFLETFGLNSLKDLPSIESFSEDIESECKEETENRVNINKKAKYINVIAIDGPAGSGKSSVSKELANKLNFFYLYTGAMYRALAWLVIENNVNLEDEDSIVNLVKNYPIKVTNDDEFNNILKIDGKDVTNKIFNNEVSNTASKIAIYKGVRDTLSKEQRKICKKGEVVVEGRDATTVICPDAIVKIYLDSTPEERARRREKQLIEMDQKPLKFNKLLKQIKERDKRDKNRKIAPLIKTEDSIYIDSTNLTINQVVQKIIDIYRSRIKISNNNKSYK
jgi:cytidylate kinase/segregation and condensation protein B